MALSPLSSLAPFEAAVRAAEARFFGGDASPEAARAVNEALDALDAQRGACGL